MNKEVNVEDLLKESEFYSVVFSDIDYPSALIQNKVFEECQFIDANFSETQFVRCKFIGCEFKNCNLSAAQFDDATFNDVIFTESKIIGINWTKLRWPIINISLPFQFYKSNLSHSSFYGLELKEIIIEECIVHDVDFRTADLTGSSFILTDLKQSQFVHTKLCAVDFTDAINYQIDPRENDIRKAKFSLPDAIHLLDSFDIEINHGDSL